MDIEIIENRLREYRPTSQAEELNAFKEIVQELTLSALSRAGFFNKASFLGGTCLRILHGLPRFSEDLGFSLVQRDNQFVWQPYLEEICQEFSAYGLRLEITDRSCVGQPIRRAFLKENSFGQVLRMAYKRTRADVKVVRIKLEIDINPPVAAKRIPHVLPFPISYSLVAHDLPTLFAGKLNAILTRGFIKGRDWFDLLWYLNRKEKVNLPYLYAALSQFAFELPDQSHFTSNWVREKILEKIDRMDWDLVRADLTALLRARDVHAVVQWDAKLFRTAVERGLL